jgi:hypothetical protein
VRPWRGDVVPKTLLEVKRRISDAVLDLNGVSGVGVRGRSVVVYLESDDAGTRARVEKMTARLAPKVTVVYEVAGRFEKQ